MKPDLKAKLEQVNEQIAEKTTAAQARWAEFEQHRDQFAAAGDDATRTDSDEFKKAEETHRAYAAVAQELQELEAVRNGIFGMIGTGPEPGNGAGPERREPETQAQYKSLGERATESDGYKALQASGVLNSEHAGFNQVLGDPTSVAELKAALITGGSDTSGGAFVDAERVGYVPQPRRMRTVLDLITTGATGSDQVKFARQTTFTNVAAETAEATTSDVGTKPEATIAFEIVTADVKTIAHWVPATRRSLADVPQLQTLIDSQLRYGLEYRLEAEVVNGNGSGENMTGMLQTANILSQAKGSDSVADAIHKAMTQIRLQFIEPNGVALHPNDWEVLRLSRDDSGASAGTGGYLYGPPALAGQETIWGLPVAVSAAVPDDTGLVADFRQSVLWLREGMQVLASDSHESFFIKNLVALLAEMRAAFGVLNPKSICKVTSVD